MSNPPAGPFDWVRPEIADAARWCARLTTPLSGDSCWGSELAPSSASPRTPWKQRRRSPNAYYSLIEASGARNTTDYDWAPAVAELIERRRSLENGPHVDSGGRLLAYLPDDNLADGAAEEASEGFFDVHNIPAWGTWVGFAERGDGLMIDSAGKPARALIAWVPDALVPLVSQGIEVNPEVCIFWVSS